MEAKVIIATVAKTTRENNKIWSVGIEGEEQPAAFCKSAYKAMRFCFLLKKRTEGASIAENCLVLLSAEIKEEKAKKAEQEAQEEQSEVSQQPEAEPEKPKRQRKARVKKNEEVANVIAFQ